MVFMGMQRNSSEKDLVPAVYLEKAYIGGREELKVNEYIGHLQF